MIWANQALLSVSTRVVERLFAVGCYDCIVYLLGVLSNTIPFRSEILFDAVRPFWGKKGSFFRRLHWPWVNWKLLNRCAWLFPRYRSDNKSSNFHWIEKLQYKCQKIKEILVIQDSAFCPQKMQQIRWGTIDCSVKSFSLKIFWRNLKIIGHCIFVVFVIHTNTSFLWICWWFFIQHCKQLFN